MERGVEDGDVRDLGEGAPGLVDGAQSRRVVKRCDCLEVADRGQHCLVDDDRFAKACSPVHDSVRDSLDPGGVEVRKLGDVLDAPAFVHEPELQARRARVDD